MNQLEAVFRRPGHKALIPYVTVGYPSLEATLRVVPLLAESGADIIELGVPFSDPLADGATIQKASFQALEKGVTPQSCLEVARQLHERVKTPLVFMTYLNPILSYGYVKFCTDCAQAGISGLIIPDLPPEEGAELETSAAQNNLDVIYLLAPNSTRERIRIVAEKSRGFIYLVSITGVTGAREILPEDLTGFIARVRESARQPLCVGFGISSGEQAGRIAQIADGVIIGSRLIQLIEKDPGLNEVRGFMTEVRQALDKAGG